MAVNGHRLLAIPSHSGRRIIWPDGTSSLIRRHPATLRNCPILKQVHRESVLRFADPATCAAGQHGLEQVASLGHLAGEVVGREGSRVRASTMRLRDSPQ